MRRTSATSLGSAAAARLPTTAHDDERVDLAGDGFEGHRCAHRQPARRGHGDTGATAEAGDLDEVAVAAGRRQAGPGEHLERPGQVEQLHPLEGDEHDTAISHGASVSRPTGGGKDKVVTIPATDARRESSGDGRERRWPALAPVQAATMSAAFG